MHDARFLGDHLLGAQGQAGRMLGRQGERFVEGVGVQALRTTEHPSERFDGHPHQIHLGLFAVNNTPAVWVWKRSWRERPSLAP